MARPRDSTRLEQRRYPAWRKVPGARRSVPAGRSIGGGPPPATSATRRLVDEPSTSTSSEDPVGPRPPRSPPPDEGWGDARCRDQPVSHPLADTDGDRRVRGCPTVVTGCAVLVNLDVRADGLLRGEGTPLIASIERGRGTRRPLPAYP